MTNPTEYEWLVPIWMRHQHLEDILDEVNAALRAANRRPWAVSTLSSVVNRLRKMGVKFPRRAHRVRLTDRVPGVARLNQLIDRLEAGQAAQVDPPEPAAPRPAPAVDPRAAIRKILDEMRAERRAD